MPLTAASAANLKAEERRRDKEQRKGRKGDKGKRNGFLAASYSRWKIQEKKKDSGLSAAEMIMKNMIIINTKHEEKEKNTMKRRVIKTFMKKHIMKTVALCAAAVVAVASSSMTAKAEGPLYSEGDGWFSGAGQDEVAEGYASGAGTEYVTYTWDVGDSAPADTSTDTGASSTSNESYDNASYDSGNSGSNDVSYDSGSNEASSDNSGSSSDSGSYTGNAGTNSNGTAASTATSGVKKSGSKVTISGFETFAGVDNPTAGMYTVHHMGQMAYALQLRDASGTDAAYKGADIWKAADGRYFINVVTADGTDTTGYSVVTMKGNKNYLPKLGISGVAINGTVIVDVDAEAAAAAQ